MHEGPKKIHGQHHGSRRARHHGQVPAPAPETTAKKSGFPVGMVAMAALGLIFIAYLTNAGDVQTGIDAFFAGQVHSAHTHDAQVTSWFLLLIPYVAMALCLAVLYVLLASFGVGKTKHKPKLLTEQLSVHEFAELAGAAGVGARVSREMFRILLPDYGDKMRSSLNRTYAELGATSENVWGNFEELVRRSGGVIRGHVGVEALGTPMQMMQAAEQSVERAALERRASLQQATTTLQERSRVVEPLSAAARR